MHDVACVRVHARTHTRRSHPCLHAHARTHRAAKHVLQRGHQLPQRGDDLLKVCAMQAGHKDDGQVRLRLRPQAAQDAVHALPGCL